MVNHLEVLSKDLELTQNGKISHDRHYSRNQSVFFSILRCFDLILFPCLSSLFQHGHLLHNEAFLCNCSLNRWFLSCSYRLSGGGFQP